MARRDDDALRALADAGGGRYVPMTDDRRDVDALRDDLRTDGVATLAADQRGDAWQDRGPWLLLPLLPLAAMSFRRGWLLLMALALLPVLPGTARAGSWSDLWQRPDQQAAAALNRGDAKAAQRLARDPLWRGAAAYRAGDYAAAASALRHLPGTDAQYNLGNALTRQGDYQGALDAYDRALKADPANADARANRKAVEDWLRQHQPPQNQGARNDKNQSGQGKSATPPDHAQGQPHDQVAQNDGQGTPPQNVQGNAQGTGSDKDARGQSQDRNDDKSATQPQTAQEQAAQRARAEQAQQALRKQMDQALGKQSRPAQPATHELGVLATDDAQSKLPADVRQALQRVPDDPGALLRRKFDLEYRQRHGAAPREDDLP